MWLRRKLRELKKSAGLGRDRPMRAVGIAVAPPTTPSKAAFRTREALVLPQLDGPSSKGLEPFITRLTRPGGGPTG
jgi:hypothetical protein